MANSQFVFLLALPVLAVLILVPFFMVVDYIMEIVNGLRS